MLSKISVRHLILIVLVFFLLFSIAFSQAGGGATAYLQRPLGVEAISLGGAYTSVATDPSAVFWNPGGLSQSNRYRFMTTYAILSLDQQHNFIGFALPVTTQFVIGGGWINYGVAAIPRYDTDKNKLGEFSTSDNAFIISASQQLRIQNRAAVGLGISIKYLYSTIADVTASGYGFDFGALLKYDKFSVGAAFQNIASSLEWQTESHKSDRVPFTFRGGVSYEFGIGTMRQGTSLRLSVEGSRTENRSTEFLAGIEGRMELGIPRSLIAVRAGYGNSLFAAGLSFGLNLEKNLSVEAQYAASGDFLTKNLLHHIGVVFQF